MARMLVEARGLKEGVPTGCTGITMDDGTVYHSNRAGHMDVEDKDHVHWMKRNGAGLVIESTGAVPRTQGVQCGRCGFNTYNFARSAPCAKCGAEEWGDENQTTREDVPDAVLPQRL
jgi:ribosomal protein L37E